MKFENFVIVSFQVTVINNHYDVYILLIYIAAMYIYLLYMHFILVTVRLWTGICISVPSMLNIFRKEAVGVEFHSSSHEAFYSELN